MDFDDSFSIGTKSFYNRSMLVTLDACSDITSNIAISVKTKDDANTV